MSTEKADVKSILLVDDEEEIRELMKGHLLAALSDIQIVEAKDGSEALAKLAYQTFHCVITDLQMPKKDGVDLIEKIKLSSLNATTPIVVVTGFPDEKILERFSNITFLEKPYDKNTLIQVVQSQLKLGKMNQRVAANVLNAFIESTESLLKQLAQLDTQVESPMAKSSTEALKGELHSFIEFKQANATSKICFGFDKAVAAHIVKAIQSNGSSSSSNPIELFLSAVFKMVAGSLLKDQYSIQLVKKLMFTGSDDFTFKELNGLKAIVMPIKTQHGFVYIQAMHLDNTRKATAAA